MKKPIELSLQEIKLIKNVEIHKILAQLGKERKAVGAFEISIWYYACIQELFQFDESVTKDEIEQEMENLYKGIIKLVPITLRSYDA